METLVYYRKLFEDISNDLKELVALARSHLEEMDVTMNSALLLEYLAGDYSKRDRRLGCQTALKELGALKSRVHPVVIARATMAIQMKL